MTAESPRRALALRLNRRVFYGWIMLVVAGVGMFASGPGQSHLFSVFVTPISDDLAVSRTALSFAYAIATMVAALGLPYVGRLIDRYGVRVVGTAVAALFGLSQMGFGAVSDLVWLTIGFCALRLLGQGSLMLSCANLVSQWFSRNRGLALSLMAFGFSISMALHPLLAQWLIGEVGWRGAWVFLAMLTWILLLPTFIGLVHNRPEDLGLEPDGGARISAGILAAPRAGSADEGLMLGEAIRTRAFWIIACGLASFSMLVTALFFHQVSIFENQGLGADTAARVFTISAVTMVTFMPIFGRMLDRLPTKPIFAAALTTMSLALVAMAFVRDVPSAILYSVMLGLNNAAIQSHMSFLWPRYFGRKHLSSIQGAGQTIGVMSAALGPVPFGVYFDIYGNYTGALIGLAALPLACAVAVLFLRAPSLTRAADPG